MQYNWSRVSGLGSRVSGLGSRVSGLLNACLESEGSSGFPPSVRGGFSPDSPDAIRTGVGFAALAAMVWAGRGLWPFRHRRLLSPRAGRRVLSASVPAPLVGRRIGPPLVLLSPLAGMAAGMALLAPGSAQAQTYLTIWSATLTVDERIVGSHSWHGCDNGGPQEKCSTALDDDDFTYAGRTYTIVSMNRTISQGERLLTVIFDGGAAIAPEIKDYATLHAGTKSFSFRTASTTSVSNSRYVTWTNPGLSWTDNQEVALSIRVPLTVTAAPKPVNGQVTLNWGTYILVSTMVYRLDPL